MPSCTPFLQPTLHAYPIVSNAWRHFWMLNWISSRSKSNSLSKLHSEMIISHAAEHKSFCDWWGAANRRRLQPQNALQFNSIFRGNQIVFELSCLNYYNQFKMMRSQACDPLQHTSMYQRAEEGYFKISNTNACIINTFILFLQFINKYKIQ